MSVDWIQLGRVVDRRVEPVDVNPAMHYRMIGLLNRGRGVFTRGNLEGSEIKYPRLYPLREQDLVFSRLFAWEGSVAISDRQGWVSAEFPIYDISPKIDRDYLSHIITWPSFVEQLANSTVGMGQRRQRVPASAFEAAAIPLPGIKEQRRVAARLDAVDRRATEAGLARSTRPSPKSLGPQSVAAIFSRASLPIVPARDLYTSISDIVQPADDPAPAQRFVGLEHVESHTGRCIGEGTVENRVGRKLRFRQNDVLYGYLRPYLNKVWVADGPGLTSVEQYALRPAAGVDAHLLAHALRSSATLQQAITATHRLQLPRLRLGLLGEIHVPDVRLAPPDFLAELDSASNTATRVLDLDRMQGRALAGLLPAARNEEFSRLVALAG